MNKRDFSRTNFSCSSNRRYSPCTWITYQSYLFIQLKIVDILKKFPPIPKNRAFNVDNRGIEPVRSGTKKGRTNPGLAGVEKITSIWESTGWRITVERSRLMTITRHAAALLLYKVSCRFSGAGFQPENDSSRSSRMFVLELAHRRFPDHRRPPSSSSLLPPAAISTLHPGNRQYLVPPNQPARPADGGRVKEHPFGVCDACRWPCTGKSRVAALNCTVAPNTCPTTGQTFDRPTPIKPMTFSDTDDNGNAAFSLPCIL